MKKLIGALIIAIVALVAIGCSDVDRAKRIAANAEDGRQAGDIIDSHIALPVPCGAVVRKAFNPYDHTSRFWYFRDRNTGILECFDTPGYHRMWRSPLKGATTDIVEEILMYPRLYPIPVATTPRTEYRPEPRYIAPPPPPQRPTPLPELEGSVPICRCDRR